jgi:hypothetical protein
MTIQFHVKPFEKKFLKKWFCPQIFPKPPECSRDGAYKKREKEKENVQKSLQIKGEVNISRGGKTHQLQKSFLM